MLTACPASLIEGRAHETILEDGARRGVLRQRLATAAPGGTGPRPPGTTTGREELAVTDPEAIPVREARDRSPKSPRWSAGRRASPVWDARRLVRRLACRVTCRPNGCLASTRRLSALRHPSIGVAKPKLQNPGAKNARRERKRLCGKMVRCDHACGHHYCALAPLAGRGHLGGRHMEDRVRGAHRKNAPHPNPLPAPLRFASRGEGAHRGRG